MAIGDIVPREISEKPFGDFRSQMEALHRAIDRMFENAWNGGFGPSLFAETEGRTGDLIPQMDVSDDDKTFRVTIELPGIPKKTSRFP
jgi:HSP20 family molecular chaperone IbpA